MTEAGDASSSGDKDAFQSRDQHTLVFSSIRGGGAGAYDLYVVDVGGGCTMTP